MPYYWDSEVARYRDETGVFVSHDTILSYVDESIEATGYVADSLAELVAEGTLAPSDFETAFREHLKREYIRQGMLGRGGRDRMEYADWGSIGGDLSFQYRKLSDFVAEIEAGQLSEAQIRARARLYLGSARQAFEKAQRKVKVAAGYIYVRWVLGVAEHCEDCVAFAALGWQRIADDPYDGCTPGSGCTVCLGNCYCGLEYAKEL